MAKMVETRPRSAPVQRRARGRGTPAHGRGVVGRGSLFHAPKYYFVAGYIVLVAATTCFFLCLIPMLPTFGCLAFCSTLFILPTFMAISRGYRLLPA